MTGGGAATNSQSLGMTFLSLTRGLDLTADHANNDTAMQLKGWRFPSSRQHLWDRNAISERFSLRPTLFFPETTLSLGALNEICQANDTASVEMTATWRSVENGVLELRIDTSADAPCRSADLILCHCSASERDDEIDKTAKRLASRLQRFYSDLTASSDASVLFPLVFSFHRLRMSKESILEGFIACPDGAVHLTPIRMKSLVDTPLASSLRSEMRSNREQRPQVTRGNACTVRTMVWKAGYLSMDTCRRLIPLISDDAKVCSMTLVGIWLSGLSNIHDCTTVAACLRFHETVSIRDKATVDRAFLVLFYERGSYAPKLYECQVDGTEAKQSPLLYSCRVLGRKSSGRTDVRIKWKLETIQEKETLASSQRCSHTSSTDGSAAESIMDSAMQHRKELDEDTPFSHTCQRETRLKRTRNGDQIPSTHTTANREDDPEETEPSKENPHSLVSDLCSGEFIGHRLSLCSNEEHCQEMVSNPRPSQIPLDNAQWEPGWSFLECISASDTQSPKATPDELCSTSVVKDKEICHAKDVSCQTVTEWQRETTHRQRELEQEVLDLKNKVLMLEDQIEGLWMHRRQLASLPLPSNAPLPISGEPTEPSTNALALVAVSEVRDATASPAEPQERVPDPPIVCGGSVVAVEETFLTPIENATGRFATPGLLDLPLPFLSCSFMDLPLPDFDTHDSELEMLSRKYLGTGGFSSHDNSFNEFA